MKNKNLFLKAFLKNPRQVGALNQTSDFVAKEIVSSIDFKKARCLVELGAGMGNITEKIIKKMHPECVLFCFEIDPALARQLAKNIRDERVKIISESAESIGKYLRQSTIEKVDCVISTVPLTTLPYRIMKNILKLSFQYLRSGGKYIQVQYSLLGRRYLRMLFPKMGINFVFLNIPPAFIYICVKS
jgi:phospholipid N-methyltransferase